MSEKEYLSCRLCARDCGIDRNKTVGFCGMSDELSVSYYSLHKWEEPPISGDQGSGTIFFDGCSLGCIFCQNAKISRGRNGKILTVDELSNVMLELQEAGAHNINFVTPTHFLPSVAAALKIARSKGLTVPAVYNTGSYDSVEALKKLDGAINVYLPDFKYYTSATSKKYSNAPDYPSVAKLAIAEMYRQVGPAVIDGQGLMKRGMIVRVLLLPERVAEAKLIVKYLYETYGDNIYISLMSQYTPMAGMKPPLDRRVTKEEYRQLLSYAERLGVSNAFVQEDGCAEDSFIPPFGEGGSICGIKKER